MGAESARPKNTEAESIRPNVNIGDESVRMTIDMRTESFDMIIIIKSYQSARMLTLEPNESV